MIIVKNLALSKTLDPTDFDQLTIELAIVDQYFTKDREQHPMRRWEYAMALAAYNVWAQDDYMARGHACRMHGGPLYDVGGNGSPFWRMLDHVLYSPVIIDPAEPDGNSLEQFLRIRRAPLGHCVFCLSTIEHVNDLDEFLYHLGCLVAPGGLLFLTMDCREDDQELANRIGDWGWPTDNRHFHWMRNRIFSPRLVDSCVRDPLYYLGFSSLGWVDQEYHGNHVYDYTFASVALVKRR